MSVFGELMEEMEMEEPTENWLGEVATIRPRRGFPTRESGDRDLGIHYCITVCYEDE